MGKYTELKTISDCFNMGWILTFDPNETTIENIRIYTLLMNQYGRKIYFRKIQENQIEIKIESEHLKTKSEIILSFLDLKLFFDKITLESIRADYVRKIYIKN